MKSACDSWIIIISPHQYDNYILIVSIIILAIYNMNFKYQLALVILAAFAISTKGDCSKSEEFFVSFHPHLDAFWLDTDDDLKDINFKPEGFLYAMNQRNSKTIFNSMYDALVDNSKRKYFISEIVFFKDWYDYITEDKRQKVKELISSGQLEIANGGWVEND